MTSVGCWNLGASADAGALAMALVAFVGATAMLIVQRSMLPAAVRRAARVAPKSRR